jgi:hypothetical protein
MWLWKIWAIGKIWSLNHDYSKALVVSWLGGALAILIPHEDMQSTNYESISILF